MKIYRRLTRRGGLGMAVLFLLFASAAFAAQKPVSTPVSIRVSIPEEIEWTWEVRPPHPDPKLSNVLLLGDSLSRNYFPQVTRDLAGMANVYLMASSTSVGDPRLPHQIREFAAMENVPFRIVHFNNGMHGWGYTEAQYKAAFPEFLRTVRSLVGKNAGKTSALIWANITPVEPNAFNGASNSRIDARNAIARSFIDAAHIPIDDQNTLMLQHQNLHQDTVHFNTAGSNLMGDQVAAKIRTQLGK
ncbi:MAG: SGNH/GDSL hydrolase family protein [Acidobacteriaceae bacterium]